MSGFFAWLAGCCEAAAIIGLTFVYLTRYPPNDDFWSLTATDTTGFLVSTPTGRSSVNSHSSHVKNTDGSVEILLQPRQPSGAAQDLLTTPPRRFKLILRVYLPVVAIVDGDYLVPPVARVRS